MASLITEVSDGGNVAASAQSSQTTIKITEAPVLGKSSAANSSGAVAVKNDAAEKEETGTFSFNLLPEEASGKFPLESERETRELFAKWGMDQTNTFLSFRFDERFTLEKFESFCRDFFHSPNVRAALSLPSSASSSSASGATPRGMGCCKIVPTTAVRMDFFNRLKEEGMVTPETGRIRQCMPEYYDGIESGSMIREMVLNEDSEHALVYDEDEKDEFLFRVFRHLIVGGGMCQPEEYIDPYFRCTRELMKGLLTVRKVKNAVTSTGSGATKAKVEVTSRVIAVEATERDIPGLFQKENDHNLCYLIVDPSKRKVAVWRNSWTSMW